MRFGACVLVFVMFLFGWISSAVYSEVILRSERQQALDALYSDNTTASQEITGRAPLQLADSMPSMPEIISALIQSPETKASPGDRISENQIYVTNDQVILAVRNAEWASFTPTHSMEPVLNEHSNAIEVVPASESEIKAGDIISYNSEYAEGTIIHRVTKTAYDDKGWYCIAKGDNNPNEDPGKIRFSQIERVVVAIIY